MRRRFANQQDGRAILVGWELLGLSESFWELLGVAGNCWELQVSPSDSQNPPSALPESSQITVFR